MSQASQHDPDRASEEALAPEAAFRSVSWTAVAAVVLAAVGTLAFVDWTLMAFPVLAVVVGWVALRRIRRYGEQLTGVGLALGAMVWGCLSGAAGAGYQVYAERAEVPHGYRAVSYPELQADPDNPGEPIPSAAYKLVGKKVFVKGYMYPGRSPTRIKEFVISRDNGSCQFCLPNPRPTDLIKVKLEGDLETNYRADLLRLGGTFRIQEEEIGKMGGVVYELHADYLK